VVLYANNNNDNSNKKSSSRSKGVYARPSAAIERGSGFFIPGLEGGRVRIAVAALLGIANQFIAITSGDTSTNGSTDYVITNVFCTLLFLQAALESTTLLLPPTTTSTASAGNTDTDAGSASSNNNNNNNKQVQQYASSILLEKRAYSYYSWVASTLMALTPATCISILSSDKNDNDNDGNDMLLYQLTTSISTTSTTTVISKSTQERFWEILSQSKTGRVSVPPTTIITEEKQQQQGDDDDEEEEEEIKTIILQRISNQQCLVIYSNQLLPSFTKNDLKWIRKLANYIQLQQPTTTSSS